MHTSWNSPYDSRDRALVCGKRRSDAVVEKRYNRRPREKKKSRKSKTNSDRYGNQGILNESKSETVEWTAISMLMLSTISVTT